MMSIIYPIYSGDGTAAIDSIYMTSPPEDALEKEVKEGGTNVRYTFVILINDPF